MPLIFPPIIPESPTCTAPHDSFNQAKMPNTYHSKKYERLLLYTNLLARRVNYVHYIQGYFFLFFTSFLVAINFNFKLLCANRYTNLYNLNLFLHILRI